MRRCPDAYGNLFSRTKACSPRWTTSCSSSSPSAARQKTQPSNSSACWTYSSRHGAHSLRLLVTGVMRSPRDSAFGSSEPALVPEEAEHAADEHDERRDQRPEGERAAVAGEVHVHPEEAGEERQRQHHD